MHASLMRTDFLHQYRLPMLLFPTFVAIAGYVSAILAAG